MNRRDWAALMSNTADAEKTARFDDIESFGESHQL
jgi:hypothetical protein